VSTGFHDVCPRQKLTTRRTLWTDDAQPLWVAGEILTVRGDWRWSANDTHIPLVRSSRPGQDVLVPLSVFRSAAAKDYITSASGVTVELLRGLPVLNKMYVTADRFDTWVPFLQVTRACCWDLKNITFTRPIEMAEINANKHKGGGRSLSQLLHLMVEDCKLRDSGAFEANYAGMFGR
jgi:hypothetical protein